MKQEWTSEHHRMARWLGYSPDWANAQECAQRVQELVAQRDAAPDKEIFHERLMRDQAAMAPPADTQIGLLREIRDLLKQVVNKS